MTPRPFHCRERQRDEGRAYPKSSCSACGRGIGTGLGTCPYDERPAHPTPTLAALNTAELIAKTPPRNSYMWTQELHAAFAKLPGNPLPTVDLLNELHQALNGACMPSDAKPGA